MKSLWYKNIFFKGDINFKLLLYYIFTFESEPKQILILKWIETGFYQSFCNCKADPTKTEQQSQRTPPFRVVRGETTEFNYKGLQIVPLWSGMYRDRIHRRFIQLLASTFPLSPATDNEFHTRRLHSNHSDLKTPVTHP